MGHSDDNNKFLNLEENKNKLVSEITITKDPIIKSAPYSKHQQQDIPCVIKESDVLYHYQHDDKSLMYPSRIVMNPRTITLYKNSIYNSKEFVFNLDQTEIFKSKRDHCCAIFRSGKSEFEICALTEQCGTFKNPLFFISLSNSFNLFKKKCFKAIKDEQFRNNTLEIQEYVKTLANVRMDMGKNEAMERLNMLRKKLSMEENKLHNSKIDGSEKLALKALDREVEIEEKIKREEYIRAKEATVKMLADMKKEEKKREKLDEAMEDRENQETRAIELRRIDSNVQNIKKDTQSEILSKRNSLKDKIKQIRKKFQRRQNMIQNRINLIRGNMTNDLLQANKAGSAEKCLDSKKSEESRNSYCDENVTDDLTANRECKNEYNFCFACCENEFGRLKMLERETCYNICSPITAGKWTDRE